MICTLDRVIYEAPDASFIVASFKTKDESVPAEARGGRQYGDRLIRFTAVGNRLPTTDAIDVNLDGRWENSKYGLQLAVEQCVEIVPKTKKAIAAYLSSGLIKGIGEKTAERIVDAFGLLTLDILEKEPERLLTVRGITEEKLKRITESYMASRSLQAIVSYLAPYGVTARKCAMIYERFGVRSMEILQDRPYVLCNISGFGFKTVDEIARKTGYDPTHPLRIESALCYTLEEAMTAGHLYLDKEPLRKQAHARLNEGYDTEAVSLFEIHDTLREMVKDAQLIHENGCIYLTLNHLNEEETAKAIVQKHSGQIAPVDITDKLTEIQQSLSITLAPRQAEAVEMCLNNTLSILTGGPGTGKTTVLRVILEVYKSLYPDRKLLLCAPTGRAARRMEESTGHPASTLHKALGLVMEDLSEMENPFHIAADLVIVDEFSMVDMALAKELFTRLNSGAQILLVGDADQLPSVGAGNVFRELMSCGSIPVTRLDLVYRQSGTSRIAINAKQMQEDNANLHYGDDFLFYPADSPEQAAAGVCQMYLSEIAQHGIDRVQILSPFRSRGDTSVKSLNDRLRDTVNPPDPAKPEIRAGTKIFRLGDRVLQTRNTRDVSNGDVGFIRSITVDEDGESTATIEFGDRTCEYTPEDMEMIELAYAMTIHKSQGSEYDTVIVPILMSHYILLRRNLLYTAITRAKKKVILVGQKKAIYTAVHKNDIDKRNTKLAERIQRKRDEQP